MAVAYKPFNAKAFSKYSKANPVTSKGGGSLRSSSGGRSSGT